MPKSTFKLALAPKYYIYYISHVFNIFGVMYVILWLHAYVTLLRGLICLIQWHIYSSIKKSQSPKPRGGAGSIAIPRSIWIISVKFGQNVDLSLGRCPLKK